MALGPLTGVALTIGLCAIFVATEEHAVHLDVLVERFQAATKEPEHYMPGLASVLSTRFGAKNGLPVKLDQIKQRVQEHGLAWLNKYEHPDGAWQRTEDAAALIEAYEQLLGELEVDQVEGKFLEMSEACLEFVHKLSPSVFERKQLKALRESGELEREVKQAAARDDVAEFLLGLAQFYTCRSLRKVDFNQRRKLVANMRSLLEARHQKEEEARIAEEERERPEDPLRIMEMMDNFEKGVKLLLARDRELVEYFAGRIAERRGIKESFDRALTSLDLNSLSQFVDANEEFNTESDAKAFLDTLKFEADRQVARGVLERRELFHINSGRRLRDLVRTSLEPACRRYVTSLKKSTYRYLSLGVLFIHFNLDLSKIKITRWMAKTPWLAKLDESGRDRLRAFLSVWPRYRLCAWLANVDDEKLLRTFHLLGNERVLGVYGLSRKFE